MQRRLDVYRGWFNGRRPHQALGGRTPEQEWSGDALPTAFAIRAHEAQLVISAHRRTGGDPRLADLDIRVERAEAA
jgi:hypothetical protein